MKTIATLLLSLACLGFFIAAGVVYYALCRSAVKMEDEREE